MIHFRKGGIMAAEVIHTIFTVVVLVGCTVVILKGK
jgi:hypothetical protein